MQIERQRGRPIRDDIDMAQVYAMLPLYSIRKISRLISIPFNTLYYRLGSGYAGITGPNPFCIKDRLRMRTVQRVGWHYFYCPQCGENTKPQKDTPPPLPIKSNPLCVSCRGRMRTYRRARGDIYFRCLTCRASTLYKPPRILRPRGRQLRQIDHEQASKLLQDYPVICVADVLGVHRNVLYNHINKGFVPGRPFRTWTPRPGWSSPSRDTALLYWPYMTASDPRYEGVIREVNEAVSREIPDETRSDICQEIVVSLLMGEITREQIKAAVKSHLKRHWKMFPTKGYQTISLDAPLRSNGHDREGRRLIDGIDAETYQEKISTFRYGDALADCSTANELAQRLSERWEANRLSGERKTYVHVGKPNGRRYSDPEYNRYRQKYRLVNGRVQTFAHEAERFGGAWCIETALPEERRDATT